jgi:hypothetical protein
VQIVGSVFAWKRLGVLVYFGDFRRWKGSSTFMPGMLEAMVMGYSENEDYAFK